MTLEQLASATDLGSLARRDGIHYRTGPFGVRLRTPLRGLVELLHQFYGATPAAAEPTISAFLIEIDRMPGVRGHWRPQARFKLDELYPFDPYPLEQAFPLLEWGLNWSIGTRAHRFLMLHAGVLERDGDALILPAMPGSGKSTLSAALAYRGWRFLTDEIGLVDPASGDLLPIPRAIPLKNRSIAVIREYLPEAFLGPVFKKTRKGDVAHLRPPRESFERQGQAATPRWVVFPRFVEGLTEPRIATLPKSLGFTRLAQNAFNYRLLAETGFLTLTRLVQACDCYSLEYGDLDSAIRIIDALRQDAPV